MNGKFHLDNIQEGKNSVLFDSFGETIFYEKLSSTIHQGTREELIKLYDEVEMVSYNPDYDSDSLKAKKDEGMDGLILNLTDSCNLRCKYCSFSGSYENERTHGNKEMNLEIAKKSIDLFIPNASDPALVSFYGGEPLNKMGLLEKTILYSKEKYPDKDIRFSMTSNFYDADKHIKTITDNNIFILASLDGPKNIHDKYRIHQKGNPTWEKVTGNLRMLDEYSPGYVKNHVGISATCANPNDLRSISDFFRDNPEYSVFRIGGIEQKGLKDSELNKVDPFLIDKFATEFLEYVEKKKIIPDVYKLLFNERLKNIGLRSREVLPEKLNLSGACYPGQRKLFVENNGDLYMCEKFGKRLPIGNVDTGIEQKVVNNSIDDFVDIREELCSNNCWAQILCSPCIQSAKDVYGEISKKGLSQTCNPSKNEIIISLALYSQISKTNKEFIEEISSSELNQGRLKNE